MAKDKIRCKERIARGQVWGAGDFKTLDEAIELARRMELRLVETIVQGLFDPTGKVRTHHNEG